jgi:hypothetical protein
MQARLAHVRDVEETGRSARMTVLGKDAGRVLHWHLVASERNEACAQLDVQGVQRRALK